MPQFDGKEVTRRQLLIRLAWYEGEYGWDVTQDDWKPRTYIEHQMYGIVGYYEMTDESLVEALTTFCDLEGDEPLRPDWEEIDRGWADWGNEPKPQIPSEQLNSFRTTVHEFSKNLQRTIGEFSRNTTPADVDRAIAELNLLKTNLLELRRLVSQDTSDI